jgi:hypothetical protein
MCRACGPLQRLAKSSDKGEETVKVLGCALLLLGISSSAFATETYREVWYPAEAGGAPIHRTAAHKAAKHRNSKPHILKTRGHRALRSAPRPTLAMRRHAAPTDGPVKLPEPDLSYIPRQITPEGNILRVDSRNTAASVTR